MQARIKWIDGRRFVGQSHSGHGVLIDGSAGAEGNNASGASPMELLLLGLGGCASIDVVLILEKARQVIEGCECVIEAERAETAPRVFTKINMIFIVTGAGMSVAKVENAAKLSAEKYCSASMMLGKAVDITHEVRVVDTAQS